MTPKLQAVLAEPVLRTLLANLITDNPMEGVSKFVFSPPHHYSFLFEGEEVLASPEETSQVEAAVAEYMGFPIACREKTYEGFEGDVHLVLPECARAPIQALLKQEPCPA